MVVIAITGLPGAGTSTVSKILAKRLNLKYFSPGEYFKKHSKLKTQVDEAVDVWKSKRGRSKNFHEEIDKMQRELAKKGNIVICGKLSIYMLKDLADVKIWIDCSLDERARRSANRDNISFDEAKKKLIERERIEKVEWERMYGFNREIQREMADIVIDNTNLNVEETIKQILGKIKL